MNLEAYITVEYTGKNGRRYKRTRKANSFVRQFLDILSLQVRQNTATINYDTSNTSRASQTAHANNFAANSGAAANLFGIVVGNGTSSVDILNFALTSIIPHGTSSGTLSYGAVSSTDPTTVDTTRQFTISRVFTNSSGSNITVKEVGIYVKASATPYYYMMDRTLNTFTINNGSTATVTYTIKVTV